MSSISIRETCWQLAGSQILKSSTYLLESHQIKDLTVKKSSTLSMNSVSV
ncbi:hypothetical protein Scep_023980 [Stephania cephalantha]|uniref:Uncharacterized protein n=1 Tax=Stephania cephalantha TaxID=152367 RepID=A0AAP0EYG3_9MAGN